jgi:cytochrome c oxidase assembly protein subunit 15
LPGFAVGVLGFMVLVAMEGVIVRATGSGAGCGNHWPLCNGLFFPSAHPRLATVIEYTHRSMTGLETALVVALIAWVFVSRPRGDRSRRAAVWSGIFLVVEALLGALLVKGGYVENNASNMRVVMQCIHFTNTMLLLAALALVMWWLRKPAEDLGRGNKGLAWLAVIATIATGAAGAVAALADTLFPSASLREGLAQDFSGSAPLLVRMRWVHPAMAVVAVVCVAWLCWRVRSRVSGWLAGLLVLQLVLGAGDVLSLAPTWMQVTHLLGADLYWIVLVKVAADVVWPAKTAKPHETNRAALIAG